MTAPGAPVSRPAWYGSRLLLVIAGLCFFLAAITAAGSDVLSAPMWGWGFGAFAAWALSGVFP